MGFHCCLCHSQNLCCFVYRQPLQVTQLEGIARCRRKLLYEMHEMLIQFRLYALIFRTWSAVRQPFRQAIPWLLPELLIKRRMGLTWPSSQLRQGRIDDDGG